MTYDNWQMTNDNSINSKCKFTKPKFRSNWGKICFSHTWTKTIQKMKIGDQSIFIQVKNWPVWRNQIFPSIQKKVKIEWKSIYVFFCTQTEAAKPTGVTDNENPSLSHFHSSSVTKEEWRQTVTDRQRNWQSKRPTKRVRTTTWKRKQNTSHSQFWTKRVEKKGWGGTGRGRERVRKRNAHVTTKWLIFLSL